MRKNENGSIEAVVIACLVGALVLALGWIFWQNFVNKSSSDDVNQDQTTSENSNVEMKTGNIDKSFDANLSFEYPADWIINSDLSDDKSTQSITLTSPSKNYEVTYNLVDGGIGGVCPSEETIAKIESIQSLKNFSGMSYIEYTGDAKKNPTTFMGLALYKSSEPSVGDTVCSAAGDSIELTEATDDGGPLNLVEAYISKGALDKSNSEYQAAKQILLSTEH